METEITWEMWTNLKAVQPTLPDNPSGYGYGWGDTNPIHNVTWRECILFANLLSNNNGFTPCYYVDENFITPVTAGNYAAGTIYCNFYANGYRLPTEGECEYFCRAGTSTPFHILEADYSALTKESCSVNELPSLATIAKYCANSAGITQPVGSIQGNNWNLKDTHGNILEWCWDDYFSYPSRTVTDYAGMDSSSDRVLQGGWWNGKPWECRAACRVSHSSDSASPRNNEAGFRLVRTL